jgi:hypothetical protein
VVPLSIVFNFPHAKLYVFLICLPPRCDKVFFNVNQNTVAAEKAMAVHWATAQVEIEEKDE